jgi:hypothetical protein
MSEPLPRSPLWSALLGPLLAQRGSTAACGFSAGGTRLGATASLCTLLATQRSLVRRDLQLEYDRDRPIVHELDRHAGAEEACRHLDIELT